MFSLKLMRNIKLSSIAFIGLYSVFSKYKSKRIYCNETKHILYLWGNEKLNSNIDDYDKFYPHRIDKYIDINGNDISSKFESIKTCEFGEYFTCVVNSNGESFIWITPLSISKVKDDNDINTISGIVKISNNLRIKDVKFTKDKLFLLSEEGNLYLYSLIIGKIINQSHYVNESDMPDEINISSDLIQINEIKNCKQIATGKDHILILLNNGDVYGMGDDSYGQLGLDTYSEERLLQMKTYGNFVKRREKFPKKIPISNIIKAACGENHSLLLDSNNQVYGMGYNRYLQISNDELYREKYIGLNKPTMIKIQSPEGGATKIIDIVCSSFCSFFVSETMLQGRKQEEVIYEIYSAGEGLKGTLGINLIKHINDIELIPDISGLKNSVSMKNVSFQSFACGNKHCLLLLRNPRMMYAWGNNEYGELGTKNRVFYESPLPMLEEYNIGNKIIKVFAGKYNSGFICHSNNENKIKELLKIDEDELKKQVTLKKEKKQIIKNGNEEKKEKDEKKGKSIFEMVKNTIKKYL